MMFSSLIEPWQPDFPTDYWSPILNDAMTVRGECETVVILLFCYSWLLLTDPFCSVIVVLFLLTAESDYFSDVYTIVWWWRLFASAGNCLLNDGRKADTFYSLIFILLMMTARIQLQPIGWLLTIWMTCSTGIILLAATIVIDRRIRLRLAANGYCGGESATHWAMPSGRQDDVAFGSYAYGVAEIPAEEYLFPLKGIVIVPLTLLHYCVVLVVQMSGKEGLIRCSIVFICIVI